MSTSVPVTTSNGSKEINLKKPDAFNGSRDKFRKFFIGHGTLHGW
jgi:hypothetical protein